MNVHYVNRLVAGVAVLLAAALAGKAQTVTGSILGTVVDPAGLAVVNAAVRLQFPATGLTREGMTDARGDFAFRSLQPGVYEISILAPGFKQFTKREIALTASETLSLGTISLEVGATTESVTVTAEGAAVQVASGERSGVITGDQVEHLLIRGRNAMSLLSLLPGVVDNQDAEGLDRYFDLNVQGSRNNTASVALEGMSLNPIGNNRNGVVTVSQDAIAEVKVLLSNYQAEYGRMSGANVNIVTKSGTKQFHGLASYFKRHEQFNANGFFENRNGQEKSRYRYHTWSYNLGGPVFIPNRFNRNREKLFFFWSQEYWPRRSSVPRQVTMPTERERTGDFSQSLDLNNRLITVREALGAPPFPGNVIPPSRIHPSGQALLKVFPLPNFFDRNISRGTYNYVFQAESKTPQLTQNLKIDYNISPRNQLFGTFTVHTDNQEGAIGILTASGANWPQMPKGYWLQGQVWVIRDTHIFSPTLINEFKFGLSRRPEKNIIFEEHLAKVQRDKVGFLVGQFRPDNNPLKLIPNATFGGITNPANLREEGRFPFWQELQTISITDNITRTFRTHTVKAGILMDRSLSNAPTSVNFNGTFDFTRSGNNPLDANHPYANALLGVFYTYSEASTRPVRRFRQRSVEWFIQDNWKALRRLTLDYGVRFYRLKPVYEQNNALATFLPERFDPRKQVSLITPQIVGGQRVGVHPLTGQVYPAALIGAFAPGAGDPYNGILVTANEPGYPRSMIEDQGVLLAPRFGFAFDPRGKGTTALRGGFGVYYNRQNMSDIFVPFGSNPPLVETPTVYFGSFATLLQSSGFMFPQNIVAMEREGKVPTVMNFSVGLQQRLPFRLLADLSYVGSLGRHLMWNRNINSIPFGSNWNPAFQDPTTRAVLPQSFMRPYLGFNDIGQRASASSSNYHSMQLSVQRRYARRIQFGGAWTWSKALDFNDTDTETVAFLVPVRIWNYGLASFDRTHILKVNWLWDAPGVKRRSLPLRTALNGWQVSGIASFISGQPRGLTYSTVLYSDPTGTPSQGARVVVLANPVLPKSERTFSRNFRTDVFQPAPRGTIGTAAKTIIRGPGVNNWDIAVFKSFPVREPFRLQFRWETYNSFNHTQFSGLDTQARFDAAGVQVNQRLSEFTSARPPRRMQFALRFTF